MKPKKNEAARPTIATLKRGHRISRAEHDKFRHALANTYGRPFPSRMGRPPKGDLKYKSVNMRIPPDVLSRIRLKAAKQGIGYQTLINQILSRAA